MRKIDVRQYEVVIAMPDGQKTTDFYVMKDSLCICVVHPSLQLDGRELLKRGKIIDKIEAAEDFVMLEDGEYEKVKTAFENVKGFSKNDMVMVDRVLNAEEIEVAEKVKSKKEVKGKREG